MGLNENNLRPVITQVTPVHSPNLSRSSQSGVAQSPVFTSDINESIITNETSRKSVESADTEDEEDEDDDEDDVREMEGRMVTTKGQMVSANVLLYFITKFLVFIRLIEPVLVM